PAWPAPASTGSRLRAPARWKASTSPRPPPCSWRTGPPRAADRAARASIPHGDAQRRGLQVQYRAAASRQFQADAAMAGIDAPLLADHVGRLVAVAPHGCAVVRRRQEAQVQLQGARLVG